MNSNNQATIEPLHKVTLTLTPEPPTAENEEPTTVALIVGLGLEGPTPFEQKLIGCEVGHTFSVDLSAGCWDSTMAPIPVLPKTAWGHKLPQSVTVTITATHLADPRDVVKEMAFSAGGCNCDGGGCDCGCGGH